MVNELKIKKKNLIICFVILLILIVGVIIYFNWGKIKPDKTIALVNGEKIYLSEVETLQKAANISGQQVNESVAIDQIISRKLLVQESQRRGISVTDEEVEKMIQDQIDQSGQTMESFQKQLKEKGVDYDKLFEAYKTQVILQKLIGQISEEKNITVTDTEAKDFYNKNKQLFNQGGQVTDFETVKDTIKRVLLQQKQSVEIYKLIDELKAKATITYSY